MAPDTLFGLGICAGALGLELGLEIAISNYRPICMVEREISVVGRVAARVQEGSVPELLAWDDVATFDGKPLRGIISIVSAGFPCQPFSIAGKRKGTSDERWIWPDIARIIGEVAPEIVFLENVPGLLLDPSGDVDRWAMEEQPDDSIGGMGTVLRDLAGLGFDAEWTSLRASDVGASHGRKRVFILAYRERARRDGGTWGRIFGHGSSLQTARFTNGGESMADADSSLGRGTERTIPASGDGTGGQSGAATDSRVGNVGNPESRRFGIVREPSGSIGQPDGANLDVEHASCSEGERFEQFGQYVFGTADSALEHASRDGECGEIGKEGRSGGRGIRVTGEQLEDSISGGLEGPDLHLRSTRSDETALSAGRAGDRLPIFAYGPADPRWQDVLVQRLWLRPSWSQAEAESYFRNLVDGLASLVAAERTGALRTLGNGVVPLQAAYAFVVLARRAGLIA